MPARLAISEARALGDLKENAEYHAAKERQAFIEGRIEELEYKLSHAQVIDVTRLTNNGKVVFGATVKLPNIDLNEESQYQILGEDEADIKQGKISVKSPIARGIIGKQVGDGVEIETPKGIVLYEILDVLYI